MQPISLDSPTTRTVIIFKYLLDYFILVIRGNTVREDMCYLFFIPQSNQHHPTVICTDARSEKTYQHSVPTPINSHLASVSPT